MSAREALNAFELAFFVDAIESDGVLSFRPRGGEAPVATYRPQDLVETKPLSPLLSLTRGQESELPAAAKIKYLSASGDYHQAVAESRRLTGASGRISQADIAIVMDSDQAGSVADSWLYEAWASRERAAFNLPPSALALEPGDTILVAVDTDIRSYRITEIGDSGTRNIQALGIDVEVYGSTPGPAREAATSDPIITGQPALLFLDLPLLRGDETPTNGYVAALQLPWPDGISVYSSPETSGFVLKAVIPAPATIGTTLSDLNLGPLGCWDNAASLKVSLAHGTLTSASSLQVLAGANAAAIQTPAGDWEIIQFANAQLVAPATYVLTRLLRRQAGSDAAFNARSPFTKLPTGQPFVLLDSAVTPIALSPQEVRLPLQWRYGPSKRDIGDATYGAATHNFQALGLRPLSPVQVRGNRDASGNLTLTWVRRTRIAGDTWDLPDIPLNEDTERYEIDVVSGANVLRTLTSTTPTVTYPVASQAIDFPVAPANYTFSITQISAAFGRGAPAILTV